MSDSCKATQENHRGAETARSVARSTVKKARSLHSVPNMIPVGATHVPTALWTHTPKRGLGRERLRQV